MKFFRALLGMEIDRIHKLWSNRLGLLLAIMTGIWAALPAIQVYITVRQFFAIAIGWAIAMWYVRQWEHWRKKKKDAAHAGK